MKTYERKTETREITTVKSLSCDRCEKNIELVQEGFYRNGYQGISMDITVAYGSCHDFAAQENDWNFDICDECCTEFLKSFKKDVMAVDLSDDE